MHGMNGQVIINCEGVYLRNFQRVELVGISVYGLFMGCTSLCLWSELHQDVGAQAYGPYARIINTQLMETF